jgi:hypothetical protein
MKFTSEHFQQVSSKNKDTQRDEFRIGSCQMNRSLLGKRGRSFQIVRKSKWVNHMEYLEWGTHRLEAVRRRVRSN